MAVSLLNKHSISYDSIEEAFSKQIKRYTYKEIKEYTVDFETVIWQSAYGCIYKGHINSLEIAVKRYNKEAGGLFLQEISNLLSFKHPNIVPVFGICFEEEVCLVLEYMSQGSIQDYINQKEGCLKLDMIKILETLIELSEALGYFHSQSLFHRDIKPGNILFDSYGKPKFSDFNHSIFYDQHIITNNTNTIISETRSYSDPLIVEDDYVGYFVDMYSFGITMLVLLSERKEKEIIGILGKARKIVDKRDVPAMKIFFKKNWDYDIGMRMLSCAMDCTKPNRKDRMTALMLSERLKEYKMRFVEENKIFHIHNEELEIEKEYYELKKKYEILCIEQVELHEIIKNKDKDNSIVNYHNEIEKSSYDVKNKEKVIERCKSSNNEDNVEIEEKSDDQEFVIRELRGEIEEKQKLLENQEENIKRLKKENSVLKEKLKKAEDQSQSGPSSNLEIIPDPFPNIHPLLENDSDRCIIIQLKNNSYHHRLVNLMKDKKKTGILKLLYKSTKKVELIPIDRTKCVYKILSTGKLMKNINSILGMCSRISFCNINTWYIFENIIIKDDIIIETNNNTLLNLASGKQIKIEGNINVEMHNFHMVKCENNSVYNAIIEVSCRGNLIMQNSIFKHNSSILRSLIEVNGSCSLELVNCTFEQNKKVSTFPDGICINALLMSNLKLKKCNFFDHRISGFESKDTIGIIRSQGNVTIEGCHFRNNRLIDINGPLILFNGELSDITIVNTTFEKCSYISFNTSTKASIKSCTFKRSGNDLYLGALCIRNQSDIDLIKCEFLDNVALSGACIHCLDDTKLSLLSCTFIGNRSEHGGGGALNLCGKSSMKLERCVFAKNVGNLGNSAYLGEGGGAVLLTHDSKAEIKSCIFENNSCSSNKGRNIYCMKKANVKVINSMFVGYSFDDPKNIYFEDN